MDVPGAVEPIASLEYFEDAVGDSGMEAQLIENTAWGSVQEHEREETRREQEQRRHGHASANDASHSPGSRLTRPLAMELFFFEQARLVAIRWSFPTLFALAPRLVLVHVLVRGHQKRLQILTCGGVGGQAE